jgi:uncharacterized protein
MFPSILHILRDQHFFISPARCIFWEEQKALIVSDLHFGKTGHFRKSGIAVPQNIFKEDLQRLISLIQYFKPQQLIAVGDLFHSVANKELDLFKKWRSDLATLIIHLVKGNHDILKKEWYEEIGIIVSYPELKIDDFNFCHDCDALTGMDDSFAFSGHIHPGIRITGSGRQALHFPCFYFTQKYCVLPAFSRFTGLALIDPGPNENVFAIVENKIIQLQ